jgi:hypothetical protein
MSAKKSPAKKVAKTELPKKKPSPPPEPELQRKIREAEFKNILQKPPK